MNISQLAFIQGIGGPELLIILVIILLLFGAKKLPELAKGLGKSMKEFKKAAQEVQDDFTEAMDTAEAKKQPDNAAAKTAAPEPTPAPAATPEPTPAPVAETEPSVAETVPAEELEKKEV